MRGAIECKDFTTMVNVLRLLCDLDDGLKTTGETGDLKEDIVITRSKGRFGHPTIGGWADIMVNFYFTDDPNQHICELQLVHTQLFTVRKKMGAHKSYGIFRAALELCEVVGANPEEGAAPSELEEMALKDPATLQLQINSLQKHVQEKDAQIVELGSKIAEQDIKIAEQDAKSVKQDAKIAEQDIKSAEQDAKIAELVAQMGSMQAAIAGIIPKAS